MVSVRRVRIVETAVSAEHTHAVETLAHPYHAADLVSSVDENEVAKHWIFALGFCRHELFSIRTCYTYSALNGLLYHAEQATWNVHTSVAEYTQNLGTN